MLTETVETMPLRTSDDVVRLRQAVRARAVAAGFGLVDQTKIVTAASEIGRNTIVYGGGGTLRIEVVRNGQRQGVRLTFEDQTSRPRCGMAIRPARAWAWAWAAPSGCATSSISDPRPGRAPRSR